MRDYRIKSIRYKERGTKRRTDHVTGIEKGRSKSRDNLRDMTDNGVEIEIQFQSSETERHERQIKYNTSSSFITIIPNTHPSCILYSYSYNTFLFDSRC